MKRGDINSTGVMFLYDTDERKNGSKIIMCLCHCGTEFKMRKDNFKPCNVKSCGCSRLGNENSVTHGMSKLKVYNSWVGIKQRTTNPKSESYQYYKDRRMDASMEDSFLEFYKEVGDPPENTQKWSIDRIDNNKGYTKGNMRWATISQQNKNKGLQSNNISGKSGVCRWTDPSTKNHYWRSIWTDLEGRRKIKYFSILKLGEEGAYRSAVEFREKVLRDLNKDLKDGYSEHHITERGVLNESIIHTVR